MIWLHQEIGQSLAKKMNNHPWFVYLLECGSGRIYTGVTPDLAARMTKHRNGTGAMFTRLNRPEQLLAAKPFATKVEAMRMEYQIKRLRAAHKRALASLWRDEYSLDEISEHFPAPIKDLI